MIDQARIVKIEAFDGDSQAYIKQRSDRCRLVWTADLLSISQHPSFLTMIHRIQS
ncbi:hypothetical protein VSK92_06920 [Bacillus swezeyi]|uniref:hypothetical protein n=1 Tax=Bacillus swezeyi TaxID=1925020 RepID=UPI0039C6103C